VRVRAVSDACSPTIAPLTAAAAAAGASAVNRRTRFSTSCRLHTQLIKQSSLLKCLWIHYESITSSGVTLLQRCAAELRIRESVNKIKTKH